MSFLLKEFSLLPLHSPVLAIQGSTAASRSTVAVPSGFVCGFCSVDFHAPTDGVASRGSRDHVTTREHRLGVVLHVGWQGEPIGSPAVNEHGTPIVTTEAAARGPPCPTRGPPSAIGWSKSATWPGV